MTSGEELVTVNDPADTITKLKSVLPEGWFVQWGIREYSSEDRILYPSHFVYWIEVRPDELNSPLSRIYICRYMSSVLERQQFSFGLIELERLIWNMIVAELVTTLRSVGVIDANRH